MYTQEIFVHEGGGITRILVEKKRVDNNMCVCVSISSCLKKKKKKKKRNTCLCLEGEEEERC